MPRGRHVPITPEVLRWAMEDAGVTVEDLARRSGTSPEIVDEWRRGFMPPSKTQLDAISRALRRSPEFFLLPSPPAEPAVPAQFRHPPKRRGRRDLLPVEVRYIRQARRLQGIAAWLQD